MDQEIKEKWVKALRSRRYQQAEGVLARELLRGGEANCCLGVLCRVVRLRGSVWRVQATLSAFEEGAELMDQVGLSLRDESYLASMNDLQEASFSEIADYIEANL